MSTLESRIVKYPSKKYSKVVPLKAIPGHFVTNHSHINHYIDLTTIKSRLSEASQCAHILAQQYEDSAIPIDTIVCLDGTDVIGTFLAQELKKDYTIIMVTHNMQQAARISDKTAFFLLGEVVEFGETEQLFSVPKDRRTEDYITGRFG